MPRRPAAPLSFRDSKTMLLIKATPVPEGGERVVEELAQRKLDSLHKPGETIELSNYPHLKFEIVEVVIDGKEFFYKVRPLGIYVVPVGMAKEQRRSWKEKLSSAKPLSKRADASDDIVVEQLGALAKEAKSLVERAKRLEIGRAHV